MISTGKMLTQFMKAIERKIYMYMYEDINN